MSLNTLLKSFVSRRLLLLCVTAPLCSAAWSQSSPSAHTTGFRYDAAKRLVGTISPDPDGSGPIAYAASRNTYDSRGVLTRVEVGELSSWQSEAILPMNWTGFTVFRLTDYTYDVSGRVLSQQQSSGGVAYQLKQLSYDTIGRPDCTAERMNTAAFAADLALNACTLGSEGTLGPDRIERTTSYDNSDRPLTVA